MFQKICLLSLEFKVLQNIHNLPHYHGGQWNAMIKYAVKRHFDSNDDIQDSNISIIPIDHGMITYSPGDIVRVGLNFSEKYKNNIYDMLQNLNNSDMECHGHFMPNETILLLQNYSRITGNPFDPNIDDFLSEESIDCEIEKVRESEEINLIFYTPFRANRPEGMKREYHTYMDEDFFQDEENNPFYNFLTKLRIPDYNPDPNNKYIITKSSLQFVDCNYGKGIREKNFGGVVGGVRVKGRLSYEDAKAVVLGQYFGAGKSGSFGLGFYNIEECNYVRKVKPYSKAKTIYDKAFNLDSFKIALNELKPNASPGPDKISLVDIKKAGDLLHNDLIDKIKNGGYDFQKWLVRYIPKKMGGDRKIEIFNISEKLIMRAISNQLTDPINRLLTKFSFAFRRKTNREKAAISVKSYVSQGFESGIKGDIDDFFSSVDIDSLIFLLKGLFPFEPLIDFVSDWLKFMNQNGIKGLSQGAILSPLLSNLYLDRFDREISNLGLKIARYSDDFVILFNKNQLKDDTKDQGTKNDAIKDNVIDGIKKILNRMGLSLNEDKTVEIIEKQPIQFLGQIITKDKIKKIKNKDDDLKDDYISQNWNVVFEERWTEGIPIYLTFLSRGCYCEGPNLVFKTLDETDKVPWSNISRIIIVGRTSFTGAVIYRALRENVPIFFIDILGIHRGALYPDFYNLPPIYEEQHSFIKNKDLIFKIAKNIIKSKITNLNNLLLFYGVGDFNKNNTISDTIDSCESIESLRGIEGSSAREYFSHLAKLVTPFVFEKRVYHPPDSPVNVLLSFGYTLLYNRIASSLKARGLNNRIGMFHLGRGQHAALASDLMEELRFLIDGMVIKLIKSETIKLEDFDMSDEKYPRLNSKGFQSFIYAFETLMLKPVTYNNQKIKFINYIDTMSEKIWRSIKLGLEYIPGRANKNDFISIL